MREVFPQPNLKLEQICLLGAFQVLGISPFPSITMVVILYLLERLLDCLSLVIEYKCLKAGTIQHLLTIYLKCLEL